MTESSKVVDVMLPLGEPNDTMSKGICVCLHYALYLMQLSVACNLIKFGVFAEFSSVCGLVDMLILYDEAKHTKKCHMLNQAVITRNNRRNIN